MFRKALNELSVQFRIKGLSPLFIKDGRYAKASGDHQSPDAIFMSAMVADAENKITWSARKKAPANLTYIPGSSLKGAWRSYLEKALRSLDSEPKVCDPLVEATEHSRVSGESASSPRSGYESCSGWLAPKDKPRSEYPYRDSCPVCRLFGNTVQASRLSIADAKWCSGDFILAENNAISRQTGAAKSPFKTMVVRDAVFDGSLLLRNFELWQVGLLARLFDELQAERVPLGSGKNKGWGRVRVTATAIALSYFGPPSRVRDGKLRGVAELVSEAERRNYGMRETKPEEWPAVSAVKDENRSSPWRTTFKIGDRDIDSFWTACQGCFNELTWKTFSLLAELHPQPAKQESKV